MIPIHNCCRATRIQRDFILLLFLLTLLALAVASTGCAILKSPNVGPATKADIILYESLAAIQDVEMAARYPPTGIPALIGERDHKTISRYLADAFAALAAYNDALDLGNAYTANQKLVVIKKVLSDLVPIIQHAVSDPATQQKILQSVDLALAVIAPFLGAK